jgi:hypothetical protein
VANDRERIVQQGYPITTTVVVPPPFDRLVSSLFFVCFWDIDGTTGPFSLAIARTCHGRFGVFGLFDFSLYPLFIHKNMSTKRIQGLLIPLGTHLAPYTPASADDALSNMKQKDEGRRTTRLLRPWLLQTPNTHPHRPLAEDMGEWIYKVRPSIILSVLVGRVWCGMVVPVWCFAKNTDW